MLVCAQTEPLPLMPESRTSWASRWEKINVNRRLDGNSRINRNLGNLRAHKMNIPLKGLPLPQVQRIHLRLPGVTRNDMVQSETQKVWQLVRGNGYSNQTPTHEQATTSSTEPHPATSSIGFGHNPEAMVLDDRNAKQWTIQEVVKWMEEEGFDQGVVEKFTENEIDGDVLFSLDNLILKNSIHIEAYGVRHKIMKAIDTIRPDLPQSTENTEGQLIRRHLKRSITSSISQPGRASKRVAYEYSIPGTEGLLDYMAVQTKVLAIHEAIKQIPAESSFSDPSYFEFLPFPSSLRMSYQRFESDDRDIPSFRYMGRSKFQVLYNHTQGKSFLKGDETLYLYGSSGSGKSHIIAALACQLIREGKRVAYIPDCRALLTDARKVLRTVLLNAFPDEVFAIMFAPDADSLLNFWARREDHYLLVDEMNALEEDSGIDGSQRLNEVKGEVKRWLDMMKFNHHYIFSASANEKSSRDANMKQAGITVIPFHGGMDKYETEQWFRHHSDRVPALTNEERTLVEFYTGRIPLFLRSLFDFQGKEFDEFEFLNNGDLGTVHQQVRNFFEGKLIALQGLDSSLTQYFEIMTGCIQEGRLVSNNKSLYDKRFFYVDDGMVGHCTCGAALRTMTLLLRQHQFDNFDSHSWFKAVSNSSGNPVVQGFLAEQICLRRIARFGLNVLRPGLGKMPCLTFNDQPNWGNLLYTDSKLCLYTPNSYNYPAIDGVVLLLDHQTKIAELFPIQITLSMHHKDSEQDFFATQWPSWITPIQESGFNIKTTFVWIDKKLPNTEIKEARTRSLRNREQLLWPKYISVHIGIEEVDVLLAQTLGISCS